MRLKSKTLLALTSCMLAIACSTKRQSVNTESIAMHADSCINTNWLQLASSAVNDSISLKIIEMTLPADSFSPVTVKIMTANRVTYTKASATDSLSWSKNSSTNLKYHNLKTDKAHTSSDRSWLITILGTAAAILIILLTIKHLFKQ